MNFKTVEEAFNHYNGLGLGEIEKRAQEIQDIVNTDPNADINSLNIEAEGLKKAKENLVEKRNSILSFNPITGTGEAKTNEVKQNDIISTVEYRDGFYKHLLGHKLSPAEQRAIDIEQSEKRAEPFNTVTDNAHVIPTLTLNEVIKKARTQGGILSEARSFNIPANLKVPVGTPLTKAEWHTEGAEVAGEKSKPSAVEFKAYELIKVFSMSALAKKMSIKAFEQYIIDELVASVMETIESSLVTGTGSKQGAGLETITFNATNQIEYTDMPAYTDFTNLLALIKRGYSNGAKFAMNNATLYSKVYSIVDGNKRPIFIADPQNESVGHILGYPVIIDDNIKDGDIYFGNFQYLGYNMPEGIALEVSTQSSFNRGLIDYRALAIADTQVILPEAFVKLSLKTA
ncbi:phage major capsid protein [Facklamia sp. P9177]|uniref:phage major capsid protein n=1 Tax=Facklamia sp. P9177 TaxID=3421945 RepID=UPI003D186988